MVASKFVSSIWNFSNQKSDPIHNLFRWYGKLPPPLVAKVLDMYCLPGDTILANFSGSGTIAYEAMIRGIFCIGTDINPLALLISKVKTTRLENTQKEYIENTISNALSKYRNIELEQYNLYEPSKWFYPGAAEKLLALREEIETIKDADVKDVLLIALLSIVRECSKIDARCVNHIVVDNKKISKDVFEEFRKESNYCWDETTKICINTSKPRFYQNSAENLSFLENDSINFVFSHPPYLNAVNYYNIYRLCTDLMNFKYSDIREKDFSAKQYKNFISVMKNSFTESFRVLKHGGKMAVVIGDVRYQGNIITLGVDFINALKQIGFKIEDIFIWELNQKAGMNVARRGNFIDHNYVIIAKKE